MALLCATDVWDIHDSDALRTDDCSTCETEPEKEIYTADAWTAWFIGDNIQRKWNAVCNGMLVNFKF